MTVNEAFLSNIKDRHAKSGTSINAFAERIGVSSSSLSRWLRGEGGPSIAQMDKIATKLRCEPWELIRPADAEATPVVVADPAALGEIVTALVARPDLVGSVKDLLGLNEAAEKQKTRKS